jgi:hypothetical protein
MGPHQSVERAAGGGYVLRWPFKERGVGMRLSKWWHGSDPVIRAVAVVSAVWIVVALGWLAWWAWPAPEPVSGVLLPLEYAETDIDATPSVAALTYLTAAADLGTLSSTSALHMTTVRMGDAHLYYDSDAGCLMLVGADGKPRRLVTQEVER